MAAERQERVSLLSVEPELAQRIPEDDLALARRHLTARLVEVPEGPLEIPAATPDMRAPFAAIVLDGLLLREVTVMDQLAAQVVGPGDIIALEHPAALLLPRSVSLTCTAPCRLGALDDPVLLAFRRWPDVGAAFIERACEQLERLALQHAIGQLPRVHDRIVATMWHLAERYGRVTPSGVHLPITLTHRLLGRLVGARRPTVSLALSELEEQGAIARRADRSWLILATPPEGMPLREPARREVALTVVEEPGSATPRREQAWGEPTRAELLETIRRLRAVHEHATVEFRRDMARYTTTRSRAMRARASAEATRLRLAGRRR